MVKRLSIHFFLIGGVVSLFLPGCTQKFALTRQPERIMYAQQQNTPAEKITDNTAPAKILESVPPCSEIKKTGISINPIAHSNKNPLPNAHKSISPKHHYNSIALNVKDKPGVLIKGAEEHYRGKGTYILHALAYAAISAVLVVAFLKISHYSYLLWVDPALFLIVVAFLIAFFLFLVCIVSLFKVKKNRDL